MEFSHIYVTFNLNTNLPPVEEDPRILATSFVMYKIGEFTIFCYYCEQLDGFFPGPD